MARCATDLSCRSDAALLEARAGEPRARRLLHAEADEAAWRVVEAFSASGLPFELRLAWTSGGGVGANARVTVARATRVCVLARTLSLDAANLADAENRVGANVGDGQAATSNTWEADGFGEAWPIDVDVPPFARRVRVELADPNQLPVATVGVFNGLDQVRSTRLVADLPADGLDVGGARRIAVNVGNKTAFRAVFSLAL